MVGVLFPIFAKLWFNMQGHTLRLVALEQNEKANAFYHFVINSTHDVSFSLVLHKLLNFFVFPAVLCLVQYIIVFVCIFTSTLQERS